MTQQGATTSIFAVEFLPIDPRRVSVGLIVILLLLLSSQLQRYLHEYRSVGHNDIELAEMPYDFRSYYVAAQIAHQHGTGALYYPPGQAFQLLLGKVPEDTLFSRTAQADGFKGASAFIYPPFAALILQPLSYFSWPVALLLWRVALSAMLLLSIYMALLVTGSDAVLLHFVLLVGACFSFFPFTETIYQGQIDPMILLLWVGGVYLLKTKHDVGSALLFAVGTLIKVSPIIMIGVFLMRRQWRWLLSYAAWTVILLGISIWRLGWSNHLLWALEIFPVLSHGVPYFANKSIAGLIYELYLGRVPLTFDFDIPRILFRLMSVLNFAIYAGTLFYLWRKNRKSTAIAYEMIVLAALALVMSPVTWRHHLLLALLPLIFLWLKSRDNWWDLSILAVSTLAMGVVFPDYLIVAVRNPIIDLMVGAVTPLATLSLLFLLLANYPAEMTTRRSQVSSTSISEGSSTSPPHERLPGPAKPA